MVSGEVQTSEILDLLASNIEAEAVHSVFAGGVYWETPEVFAKACAEDGEHAIERLLELRAYNATAELRAVRTSIAQEEPLQWRLVSDNDFEDYLDDTQYLDIDKKRSRDIGAGKYVATGGGTYSLPMENAERIKLRNYLQYDEDGVATIVDFRIVGLLREGEE